MYLSTLKAFVSVKRLNQSQVAKMAGVSRQTVSYWFLSEKKQGARLNIQLRTYEKLTHGLQLNFNDLNQSFSLLEDESKKKNIETLLLWDQLYPDLIDFIRALLLGHPKALARLVQVFGIFKSEKIIGKKVWKKFQLYKKFMHPKSQERTQNIWNLLKSQNMI